MRRLLKINDVCELLGVGRKAVWQMTRDGRLRSVTIGLRTVRFRQEDVEKFVDDWTTQRRVG